MSEENYYVLMAVMSPVLSSDGHPPRIRFKPPTAEKLALLKHVPLFTYYNPVLNEWYVNEKSTGMEISRAATKELAIKEAEKFFIEVKEELFFAQMKAMGRHSVWPIAAFDQAMMHCRAALALAAQGQITVARKK